MMLLPHNLRKEHSRIVIHRDAGSAALASPQILGRGDKVNLVPAAL